MNLTEMRADIRTELSDASTFFSNTEIDRAVQKSVSLMSRIIPKKTVIETTIIIDVDDESFTTPATASATAILTAKTLNGKVSGDTLTPITDNTPDVPRRLTVTLTDADASVTALTIIVKGYDTNGNYIEEIWYLKDLPTGTAVQGDRYFKYISEVEVDNVAGTLDVADTVSVGTGNAYDSYKFLANKAILPESEVVTSSPAGTTYTRDTDYRMDYINGRIKFINGGSMVAGTSYLISYDLDSVMLDISSLLPRKDYIKIDRVEYPVGDNPPTYITYEVLGDILFVKGKDVKFTEDYHLRIQCLKPWTAPNVLSDGDYPEHLDDPVIIGSAGQALIFKAEKYVQQSIAELELVNAAADSMATPLADINTALDRIAGIVGDAVSAGLVGAALDKVTTYLETNGTTDNAKDVLANITDDIADMRTAIKTALDLVGTYITNATTPPSAHDYLIDGDDYITTINDAERVAEKYAAYAQATIQIYQTLIAEATVRLDNLRSHIEEAQGWIRMGDSFTAEATQRLGQASLFANEATQRINEVNAWAMQADRYALTSEKYLEIAGRFLASGQSKINEFLTALGVRVEYQMSKGSSEQFA